MEPSDKDQPDFLVENLRLLEGRGLLDPCTKEALASAEAKLSRLKVSSEGGWLFEDPESKLRVLLHSKRFPDSEAERQVKSFLSSSGFKGPGVAVALGAAGLFHVEALAKALPKGSSLLVVEPCADILLTALRTRRLAALESPGVELRFLSCSDLPKMLEDVRFALRGLDSLASFALYLHPASARTAPALYAALERGVLQKLRFESMNRETLKRFSKKWIENSLLNLPRIASSPPAGALARGFEGCSAIVVGAGPSLDSALPLLKSLKEKFLIVAAGTALKPLLAAGVEPDFAVAVDSDPVTLRQYEGLPPSSTRLACCMNVDPALPKLFPGRCVFFSANLSEELNGFLEGAALLPDRLSVGGTVAVSAMDFARLLGCRRIALCGVDLAMSPEGFTHASGSVYSGAKAGDGLVEVKGNWQDFVRTTEQFATYVGLVGNFAFDLKRRWGVELFNATCAGARIENATLLRPEALPSLAVAFPGAARARLDDLLAKSSPPGAAAAPAFLKDALSWLERAASEASKAEAFYSGDLSQEDSAASAEAFFKRTAPASALLGAFLSVELRELRAQGAASPARLFASFAAASLALAEILRRTLASFEPQGL